MRVVGEGVNFDLAAIRADFPVIAHRVVHDQPLVYLDSAATAQKPQCVIDSVTQFYSENNANINRGVHVLAEETTLAYEASRQCVADFIGAQSSSEIVFTSGTTESINLLAHSLGLCHIHSGDEIILTGMEHHANIVPWQQLCERVGARLRVVPVDEQGVLDWRVFESYFNKNTKLVTMIHVSNVMGCKIPAEKVIACAREHSVPVLLDGAQAIAHTPVDVQSLGCDFYVFSAHKLYGPTGVGVLYARSEWLDKMPPYQTGGDMIRRVSFDKATFNTPPHKFEAGTPNIAGVIALSVAIQYFSQFSWADKLAHEKKLLKKLMDGLSVHSDIRILGPDVDNRLALVAFEISAIHAHDMGSYLDQKGIAARVGHHCAMPLIQQLGLTAATRVSVGLYNTEDDIERFLRALDQAIAFFTGGVL